jgi:hypothetical protein
MGRAHVPLLLFFLSCSAIGGDFRRTQRVGKGTSGSGHGGKRRRRGDPELRQGIGGEDHVSAGVRLHHGASHRPREGFLSGPFLIFAVGSVGTWNGTECGLVRRRRRYRRSRRRAPRGWRGEAPSCPTSSAPMPRLVVWLNCCLMRTYWPWC